MARFHPLTVAAVDRDTRDSVVVALTPPADVADAYRFLPGQYLTFRRSFDGVELRRSYSICSAPRDGVLRIGVKRVEGGCFSGFCNSGLKMGDVLESMPPAGTFTVALDPGKARHFLMFAAGSGITPVLGLVRAILAEEPQSRVTLVYGNRSISTIMFREELEDLKNDHLGRLAIVHVLGSEQDIELFSGRINADKCRALFAGWIDIGSVDLAFICGPEGMMLDVRDALRAHGFSDDRIRFELFASAQPGRGQVPRPATAAGHGAEGATLIATLDGATRTVPLAGTGQSVLDALLSAQVDAPHACKAGVCSTCRAKVLEGEVDMAVNYALEDYEVARGYVLTCQAHPRTSRVVVDYDQ